MDVIIDILSCGVAASAKCQCSAFKGEVLCLAAGVSLWGVPDSPSRPVSSHAEPCSYNDKVDKADVLDDAIAKIPAKRLPNLDPVPDADIR